MQKSKNPNVWQAARDQGYFLFLKNEKHTHALSTTISKAMIKVDVPSDSWLPIESMLKVS